MNNLLITNLRVQPNGYCSQSFQQEEKVSTIQDCKRQSLSILNKRTLCSHDVDELNRIYSQCKLLEKRIDKLPNTQNLEIEAIFRERIERSSKRDVASVLDLIILHKLTKLTVPDLNAKQAYEDVAKRFIFSDQNLRELAETLPCCHSEDSIMVPEIRTTG